MKTAETIVAALADNPPTAELLSALAPQVQENIKRGWTKVLEGSLATEPTPMVLEGSLATEPTPTVVDPPAPGPTLVVDESSAQNAAAAVSPAPEPAQS